MATFRDNPTYPYHPDYAVPPGWLLRDYLNVNGFTPEEFARRHSLAMELVEGVLAGSAPLDAKLAAILEREFDLGASFWLDIEAEYHRLTENATFEARRISSGRQISGADVIMTTSTVKRILCLANSRKLSGRCIAGKEVLANGEIGGWIRPVSDRETEEVSEWERQYENGSDPCLLDVIDVPLLNAKPKDYQQENWLIDPEFYWEKVRSVTKAELMQYTDPVSSLWIDGHSTVNGQNDRIPLDDTSSLTDSLRFIRVKNLELHVSRPGMAFGNYRRSVQGRFDYNGMDYWLRVTDPGYERKYLQQPNGEYQIGECFLTVSLAEPYRGDAYKLIAAIIKP